METAVISLGFCPISQSGGQFSCGSRRRLKTGFPTPPACPAGCRLFRGRAEQAVGPCPLAVPIVLRVSFSNSLAPRLLKRPVLASAWIGAAEGKVGGTLSTDPCSPDQHGRMQGSFVNPECWGHPRFLERTHEAGGSPFPYSLLPVIPLSLSPLLSLLGLQTGGLEHEMNGDRGQECRQITSPGSQFAPASCPGTDSIAPAHSAGPRWNTAQLTSTCKLPRRRARPAEAPSVTFPFWCHLEKEHVWVLWPTGRFGVLLGCVALGNSFHLSEGWFPQPQNEDNMTSLLTEAL